MSNEESQDALSLIQASLNRLKFLSGFLYLVAVGGFGLGVWVTTMQVGMNTLRSEMDDRIREEGENIKRREVLSGTLSELKTNSANQTTAIEKLTDRVEKLIDKR